MKDPELRFCSLLARGLLVDLLCMMFESSRQGELAKPDGTPRSDCEIADAIPGARREDKIAALRELENAGVIKRNENTGVLYSNRILEIAKRSETYSKNGAKGGAKRKLTGSKSEAKSVAKHVANTEANLELISKQNGGVSDTDTDTEIYLPSRKEEGSDSSSKEEKKLNKTFPLCASIISSVDPELANAFRRWIEFRFAASGQNIPEMQQEVLLMDLSRRGVEKAKSDIEFSIRIGAKNILDSSHDLQKQQQQAGSKSYGQTMKDKVGI